ncbi:MAG: condensation domain-containing protein [Coriobacteriales bacterium]|jgi:amino acid adenylation domain-containing protein|nr:condensation domain-containing protein [Coriobacteriales bacterium]
MTDDNVLGIADIDSEAAAAEAIKAADALTSAAAEAAVEAAETLAAVAAADVSLLEQAVAGMTEQAVAPVEHLSQRSRAKTDFTWSTSTRLGQLPDANATAVARSVDYPLTDSQRQLLAAALNSEHEAAGNLSCALTLSAALDIGRLAASFQALVDRHQALRLAFHLSADGQPRQSAVASVLAPLATLALPDFESESLQTAMREFFGPFNLDNPPLIRLGLGVPPEPEQRRLLLLEAHRVVADDATIQMLLEELGALYAGETLPPAPAGYLEYVLWQEGQTYTEQRSYWLQTLANLPAPLTLPLDFIRPPQRSNASALLSDWWPAELSSGVEELAQVASASPFSVVAAAVFALLAGYGRSEDFCLGMAVSGRSNPAIVRTAGAFANTLPLRARPRRELTFRQLVGQVEAAVSAAREYQDYPCQRLMEESDADRDFTAAPLFNVMLAFQSIDLTGTRLADVEAQLLDTTQHSSCYDLSLNIRAGEEYCISAEYAPELFGPQTIQRLLHHLQVLLGNALIAPDLQLGELSVLDDEERKLVLSMGTGSAGIARPLTLPELLAAAAEQSPDVAAVECAGDTLSYAQLEQAAAQIAAALNDLGVARGDRVALALPRSVGFVAAAMGISQAGAAWVPIDLASAAARAGYIVADVDCRVVLVDSSLAVEQPAALAGLPGALPQLDLASLQWRSDQLVAKMAPKLKVLPGDLACCIHTSNTTGRPKSVLLEHRGLGNLQALFADTLGIERGSRVLGLANVALDASVWEWLMALSTQSTLHLVPGEHLENEEWINSMIAQLQPVVSVTPAQLAQLELASASLVVCFGAEAPVPADLTSDFVNVYGPTEATICATVWPAFAGGGNLPRPLPIGGPIPGAAIYVVDERLQLAGIGQPGELVIGGTGVARGYCQATDDQPGFLANPFAPGRIYRTGELVRYNSDGELLFFGRNEA